MRVALVYLRPRQVGFMRATGPLKASAAVAWRQMDEWLARHNLEGQVNCGYGLAMDAADGQASDQGRYDACVELPGGYENLRSDGLSFQTLPGGAFARIRHVGPYGNVRSSVAKVRDKWLPKQKRLLIDRRRPLLVIYLDDPKLCTAAKLRSDVCVPVRTHYDDIMVRARLDAAAADDAFAAGESA